MMSWKNAVLYKLGATFAIIAIIVVMLPILNPIRARAAANGPFQLNAAIGVNGYYDGDHLVPVTVRIHNPGAKVKGYLSVKLLPTVSNRAGQDGTLHYPVSLGANSVTKKTLVVPGSVVEDEAPIHLVVDGRTVASTVLSGNALGRVALVVVVSNSPQATQFLAGSSDPVHQEPVLAERISPADVPTVADWFDSVTAVAITPTVLQSLTTRQRDALQSWVKLGGLLMVTGPAPKLAGWTSSLPLARTSAHYVSSQPLMDFTGTYETIPGNRLKSFAKPLASNSLATAWAGTSKTPLVAGIDYGRGTIVETAFQPLDTRLLTWSENTALWSTVIQRGLRESDNSFPALTGSNGALSLTSSSDALSPMRVPPLGFWGPLFLAYVVIIGPLLFLLLRRYRREPMAWWLLPAISLITTGGIYGFGAIQRPHGVLAETVGMMELTENGPAEVYGVTGFTSPYVTDAQLTTNGASFALPLSPPQASQGGLATSLIGSDATAQFTGVGRWNLRYLYSQGTVNGQGKLLTNLNYASGNVVGTVTNKTHLTLHDVAVLWKGKLFEVGDMKPGAKKVIGQTTKYRSVRGTWLSEYGQYNGDVTHGLGRALGSYIANTDSTVQPGQTQAMILATSSLTHQTVPGLPQIHTAQKVISDEKLVFVRQFAKLTAEPVYGPTAASSTTNAT